MKMYQAYGDDGGKFYIGEAGLVAYGPDILKPPHLVTLPPQPEPEPLTEDELAALREKAEQSFGKLVGGMDLIPFPREVVYRLIAELRRLRVEVASLRDALEYPDECE